ncbi:hypothetical protein QP162_16305 [Sphingomonas aurantiaca]
MTTAIATRSSRRVTAISTTPSSVACTALRTRLTSACAISISCASTVHSGSTGAIRIATPATLASGRASAATVSTRAPTGNSDGSSTARPPNRRRRRTSVDSVTVLRSMSRAVSAISGSAWALISTRWRASIASVDKGWLISWMTATDIARSVLRRSAWNSIRSRRATAASARASASAKLPAR